MASTNTVVPFKEMELDTAEQLIDELTPHHGTRWKGLSAHDRNWIYRGQANSEWDLTPAAMRPGVLSAFLTVVDPPMVNPPIQSGQAQRDYEESVVTRFATGVDHQGLPIPGDHQGLRDKSLAHPRNEPTKFPQLPRLGIYALAQHHGVPTRLLDWSHDARVAAYFAAVEVAALGRRDKQSRPSSFSVWALSRSYVDRIAHNWEPSISIVTAPTTSNPNLRLQRGLFTLVGYREEPAADPIVIPTVDELMKQPRSISAELTEDMWRAQHFVPPLWKYTVPSTQARVLLRFLAIDGVSGGTLFHGHDGVVKGMREECLHQKAPPHDRS